MRENPIALTRISTIFLTWRRHLQKDLVPYNITLKQYYVLKELMKTEFLNPSVIAGLLYCDRPTATVVINNMEKQGWIKKEKDQENRKQIKITITDEGKEMLEQLEIHLSSEECEFDPMACFTQEEVILLETLLKKWCKHMKGIEKN